MKSTQGHNRKMNAYPWKFDFVQDDKGGDLEVKQQPPKVVDGVSLGPLSDEKRVLLVVALHRQFSLTINGLFIPTNSLTLTFISCNFIPGSRDSFLVRAPDSWLKGCVFESRQERRDIFFSRVVFVCWLLFGVRSSPASPQWHVKDPGYSAKNAGDRLHLNTHTPLTQRSPSGLTMLRSRHSVGAY